MCFYNKFFKSLFQVILTYHYLNKQKELRMNKIGLLLTSYCDFIRV